MHSSLSSEGSGGSSLPSSSRCSSVSPASPASPPGPHSLTTANSFILVGTTNTAEYIARDDSLSSSQRTRRAPRGVFPPVQHTARVQPMQMPPRMFPSRNSGDVRGKNSSRSSINSVGSSTEKRAPHARQSSRDDQDGTTLDSRTAISLSDPATEVERHGGSASDTSLPSILATAPQPPPAPLRQRISHITAIAPLNVTAVDAAAPQRPLQPVSDSSSSSSSFYLPPRLSDEGRVERGGGTTADNNNTNSDRQGGGQLTVFRSEPTAVTAAGVAPTRRGLAVYAAYNVHPVLRRAAHPLFQHDVPRKIGRQTNGASTSNFFPLSVPQVRSTASVPATMSAWSSQASSGSPPLAPAPAPAAMVDGTPRRGFRFPQPAPSSPAAGSDGARRHARRNSLNQRSSEFVELLSTTHSTDDRPYASPSEEQLGNPPQVLKTCPSPSLEPATAAVSLPSILPTLGTPITRDGAAASSTSSGGRRRSTSPPLLLPGATANSSSSSTHSQGTSGFARMGSWGASHQSPASLRGAGVSLTSFSTSQSSPQRRSVLHLAVPTLRSATPSTHPQPRTRVYSRRDLRRGRWIVNLAKEECEAREALEEAAAYEAIRTLPASCRVWKTYIDPAFDDEYDALGYYLLARAAQTHDVDPALRVGDAEKLYADGHGSFPAAAAEGDEDEDGLHSVVNDVRTSLARQRRQLVEARRSSATLHPAFVMAARRLVLLEDVCRSEIAATEDEAFRKSLRHPYVYEHRLMTVGTLPLERFLRRWIAVFRARRIVHARQRERLFAAERDARDGLLAASSTLAAWQRCQIDAVVAEERHYRTAIELLHAQDAAWCGVVLLRLREHVELFSLLYGGTMRQTRVCGRVERTTLFRSLAMAEEATRGVVALEEETEWCRIPATLQLRFTVVSAEPQARAAVERAEAARRVELAQVIYALTVHYTKRDVELREYDERQGLDQELKELKQKRAKGTVREEESAARATHSLPARGESDRTQHTVVSS